MSPHATDPAMGSALRPIGDRSETQVLDRVSECAVTWQRMGAELLVLAYEWAVAHPADRLDPVESAKPGREKATLHGGPGTPEVTEFAAAEFGARMGRGTHAGRRHLAAALDLKLRLPLLWSRVQALEVRDTYAIHVAEATRSLSAAEAAWVDGEVAEQADGRIPWTRFQTLVAGKVSAAAPHLAREREERAARARFAKVLKPLPGDQPAGMATFMVRAPLPVIDALDHAVTTLASRLAATLPTSVTESEDAPSTADLRVQAVAVLATGHPARTTTPGTTSDGRRCAPDAGSTTDISSGTARASDGSTAHTGTGAPSGTKDVAVDLDPGDLDLGDVDLRDLLPRTSLVVHLYGGTTHTTAGHTPAGRDVDEHGQELHRVARIEGHGPVTETWLRDILGPFSRFEVLPVLDIDGLAPVDAYEIPTRHRRAVQLRHPVETFPYGHATSTSSHIQLDHEQPWQPPNPDQAPSTKPPPGQTRVDNLGPLHSFHHRLKTHGGWAVREPAPGVHLWRDPHGDLYLRDASGTRRLDWKLPDGAGGEPLSLAARAPDGSVIEMYPQQHSLVLAGELAVLRWSRTAA